MLRHPTTWPFLVFPVLITGLVFAAALYIAWHGVPWALSQAWVPGQEEPLIVTHTWGMLVYLLRAATFLVVGLVLYFSAGLVAVPFNDRLSQKVEHLVLGEPATDAGGWWVGDISLSVMHSGFSAFLYLSGMALLFLLELFPGPGSLVHIAAGLLLTSVFLVREMMDGAMSRRRMSYGRKLRVVGRNLPMALGFGLVASVLTWIPLMNFVFLPMMVAGGTVMFCHLERSEMVPA